MVRVRRANQDTRQTPSIRETSRHIRRNRRTQRLPHTIVSLDNEIITPTPEIIEIDSLPSEDPLPFSIPEPEVIEIQERTDTPIDIFVSTTSSTEDHYFIPAPREDFPDNISEWILETGERRAEIAPNTIAPDQYNYSPEEDDFYPPPSYSPVTYEDQDPFTPLEIPPIEIEIPIATIDIEYSYILPDMYGYPREE